MRILVLKCDTMISSVDPGRWNGHEFHRTDLGFANIAKPLSEHEFEIDRRGLEALLDKVKQGFDVVFCETIDAVLIEWMRAKRGDPPMRYILQDEDGSLLARRLNGWLKRHYGEAPFPSMLLRPGVVWFFTSRRQRPSYRKLGVRSSRLFYVPPGTWWIRTLYPAFEANLSGRVSAEIDGEVRTMFGQVISSGQNDRDFLTLAKAMRGLSAKVHVLTQPANAVPIPPPNFHWHAFLPMDKYLEVIRKCRCLVVPLRPGAQTGGQTMALLAMALGRPVVVSRVPWTRDYLRHGISAMLPEPGDPESLRDAIRYIIDNPDRADNMGRTAARVESDLSRRMQRVFRRILRELERL